MRNNFKILKPSFFEKCFGTFHYIQINKSTVKIYRKNFLFKNFFYKLKYGPDSFDLYLLEDFPILRKGILSSSLIFRTPGKTILIKGISNNEIDHDYKLLIESYGKYLENKLDKWWEEVKLNTEDTFLRDSMIPSLNNMVANVNDIYQTRKQIIKKYLPISIQNLFSNILNYHPIINHTAQIRYKFEQNNLNLKNKFFANLESYPLTEEQSLAIIRDNDKNLILAAAGTGKTSVIVGKSLDLVLNEKYKTSNILVLAYGNAASKELDQRIKISKDRLLKNGVISKAENSWDINPSTFHSLGRNILIKSKKPFVLSKLAEDKRLRETWFEEELQKYITRNPKSIHTFIDLLTPVSDPLSFENIGEYELYLRDNPHVTLAGEKVRGYQETIIANWLYKNGIPYKYESIYEKNEDVLLEDREKTYRPDFAIICSPDLEIKKGTNIYIEHNGIDRKGNTREDIDEVKYNKRIEWQRKVHNLYHTKLIETYHYNWTEGGETAYAKKHNLEQILDKKISKYITKNPKSDEELLEELKESGRVSEFAQILSNAVTALRIGKISIKKAKERLEKSEYTHTDNFIPFLIHLKNTYEEKLKDEAEIDFDDMILQATECIKNGEFKPNWKYILVDEFQDISQARMDLLNELLKSVHHSSLFTVGDDWQSIYRFTGGKLELTTRYADLIGSHSLTKLQKTFRYNNSIANVAGRFVMTNPEQYKKEVITHHLVNNSQIHIVDTIVESENSSKTQKLEINENLKVYQIIEKIKNNNPSAEISVLSRYNYILKNIKNFMNESKQFNNINYWTFHRSKGREADYCILVGFSQGKLGFPNTNMDYAAVEALLPSLDTYLHSEERRLMYVALTRTRNKSFILANPLEPSHFINELLIGGYDLVLDSEKFSEKYRKIFKCNFCTYGFLIRSENSYGVYYRCNSFPGCDVIAKLCQKCSAPMEDNNHIRKCKNPECNTCVNLCPKCNRPLYLRKGKFGEFYGCSGYSIDPPYNCSFTMNLDGSQGFVNKRDQ